MALTSKQELFVQEYLIDLNATQAAIRAGYSKKTAHSIGSENLCKPEIAEAIAHAKAARSERTEVTQDRVIAELAKIGFSDIRKAVAWGQDPGDTESENANPNGLNMYPVRLVPSEIVDDDTAAAITEVSLTQTGVKVRMADKRAALETLLKHVSGQGGDEDVPALNINITSNAPVSDVRITRPDS